MLQDQLIPDNVHSNYKCFMMMMSILFPSNFNSLFHVACKKGLLLMDWTIEKKSILKSTFNNFISLPSLTISFHLFLSHSFQLFLYLCVYCLHFGEWNKRILQFVINLIAPDIVKLLEKSIILCKAINHVSYFQFLFEIFL